MFMSEGVLCSEAAYAVLLFPDFVFSVEVEDEGHFVLQEKICNRLLKARQQRFKWDNLCGWVPLVLSSCWVKSW